MPGKLLSKAQMCDKKISLFLLEAERINARKREMEESKEKISAALMTLEQRLEILKSMTKEINILMKDYKASRNQFIEKEIENALTAVLDQDYKVQLTLAPYRDSYRADLKLYTINQNGEKEFYKLATQNGGLCRQIVMLSSGFAIAKLMGCHTVFMDEACNGGDTATLRKAQAILKSFVDYHPDNVVILNEHNEGIYQDLDTTVYTFHKEGKNMSGKVVMDEVVVNEGSVLTDILI